MPDSDTDRRQLAPLQLTPLPDDPLVSVLIANFNYARFIGEAIESLLGQTWPNLEVVVCDDGSSDNSCEVVEGYIAQGSRVKLVRLAENSGMAAAINAAFAASRGEIICLLDADDTYAAHKIELVVSCFTSEPRTGLIVHPMMIVDAGNHPIQQIPCLTRFERGWIAERLIQRGGRWRDMPTSALCFRREPAGLVFPIPEKQFRRAADGFIFTLLPLLTEVSALDEVLTYYRIHSQNDYASMRMDALKVQSELDFMADQVTAVNARLHELGLQNRDLVLERNLIVLQRSLVLLLLTKEPFSRCVRAHARMLPVLLRDDLYGFPQKFLGVVVFTIAILLPGSLRQWWFTTTLGFNRYKRWGKRLVSRTAAVAKSPLTLKRLLVSVPESADTHGSATTRR